MPPLADNNPRSQQIGDIEDYPVAAATTIYGGAAVGEDGSGAARPLQAGDVFLGFADTKADNAAGSVGAVNVRTRTKGKYHLPVTGVVIGSNSRAAVYASDDNTFTLTAGGNSLIGYVSRYVSDGNAVVEFDAAWVKAALQA